jgi:chromosome segregation ATPase
MLDSSRKVVEQNRERISELQKQVAQNEVSEEQLAEEQKRLQANIDVMNRSIKNIEQDKQTYQALADQLEKEGQDVAGLRSQVESMNLQIAALEQERNALEEINQTVRIG